jgi:hypothetical protein
MQSQGDKCKEERQYYVKKLLEHGKIHAARSKSTRIVGGFLEWVFFVCINNFAASRHLLYSKHDYV